MALKGRETDRPLFCPAIYEHLAKLVGKSPSDVGCSPQLLEQAVLAEYETYDPDMLTVGIDIYNIEAETLGSEVTFSQAVDSVPIIRDRILSSLDDFHKLCMVEPQSSGRMPLLLTAAKAANDKVGAEVFVRGAVSAPYSIAVELIGVEKLLFGMIEQPEEVNDFLSFLTEISIRYGRAFIDRGVEVCAFDSYAAPPLVSPDLYRDIILPHVRRMIAALKARGAEFVEYVIGGRTEPIARHLFATGADILLCDFAADVNIFLELAKDTGVLVRRNISPVLIEQGPDEELAGQIDRVRKIAAKHRNVVIGTGAISYNTSAERVLMVKQMCLRKSGETK